MKTKYLALLALLFSGCQTTRIDLGPTPSGKIEEDHNPVAFFSNEAPDIKKHCSGGNVASVTVSLGFLREDVLFNCADARVAKADAGTTTEPVTAPAPGSPAKAPAKKAKKSVK